MTLLAGNAGSGAAQGQTAPPPAAAPSPPTQLAINTTEAEGTVFERQLIMTDLSKDAELLGQIVAGSESADKLPQTTRAIAKGAHEALDSYRNKVPGGRSKPEVWSNYADFIQRMDSFAHNADAMAKAGESRNIGAVTALMIDALPCKQCHDLYRAPKTK